MTKLTEKKKGSAFPSSLPFLLRLEKEAGRALQVCKFVKREGEKMRVCKNLQSLVFHLACGSLEEVPKHFPMSSYGVFCFKLFYVILYVVFAWSVFWFHLL